jgi:internalin A
MRRRLSAMAPVLLCCALAWAEEPVKFGDATLQAVVEEALWVQSPTPSDMLGFTYLEARGLDITSVVGLEYATNLYTLRLGDNQYIADVTPLAGLTNLTTLILNQNSIADLSPLAGLVNLTELDVHHNQFRDIAPLAGMMKLRRLALRENAIRDISPLAGLTGIETLVLSLTEVNDISPLLGMRSLQHLDLRECPLARSAYDTYIPQIQANNPGVEIRYDPLRQYTVEISSSAGGSVTCPGEGQFTFETGQIILLVAKPDPGCVFRNWSGAFSGTQNPTSLPVAGDYSIQANFLDLSNTLFVDDTGPGDPQPGHAAGSDPNEDGTMEHPFDTIQEAIDAAAEDMSIFVRPGLYRENIDFSGKNIRLVGANPDQPEGSQFPVIEGAGPGPIVSFTHGEVRDCKLTGFVITRGVDDLVSAILCDASSPTIANCLIVGNRSTHPNGSTVNCRESRAAFVNCTIADNVPGRNGAALRLINSSVAVNSSILWSNGPVQILVTGGSSPQVEFDNIEGGWPGVGNISSDPLFVAAGYWANPGDLSESVGRDDANAVWIDGDYHLKSQAGRRNVNTPDWHSDAVASPSIDAGDPRLSTGDEPAPNGGIVNQGVYGGTLHASKSGGN